MIRSGNSEMKTIKPLPEGVRHSMRSGIILFDMARVVEELVSNSLDAGATKVHKKSNPLPVKFFCIWKSADCRLHFQVSIFVGVVTCSVKVVDDGEYSCTIFFFTFSSPLCE